MNEMEWQSIETAPKDGTRIWLAFSTGPKPTDWNMAACRYSNIGWYLSPNGEIGSPIYFQPTYWMIPEFHKCSVCGEPNPEYLQRDGCRDPDCPEQA